MICKESKQKRNFKSMLKKNGLSKQAVEELFKWYDFSEKQGAASY
jgi:hypothetical protein